MGGPSGVAPGQAVRQTAPDKWRLTIRRRWKVCAMRPHRAEACAIRRVVADTSQAQHWVPYVRRGKQSKQARDSPLCECVVGKPAFEQRSNTSPD